MAPAIADRRPKYVTKSRVIQRHAEVSGRCLFLPKADIGCAGFMGTHPSLCLPIPASTLDHSALRNSFMQNATTPSHHPT
jgi:hypothetical protein